MKSYHLTFLFLLVCCTTQIEKNDIKHLHGYWMIDHVIAPNNEKRAYIGADEVDFFEVDKLKGFRKKVKPQNDIFFSNSDQVDFSIAFGEKNPLIVYEKNQTKWQEEVVALNTSVLELKDERGVIFVYKRYRP